GRSPRRTAPHPDCRGVLFRVRGPGMTLKAVVSRYSEVSRILRHFSGYCFVRIGLCITGGGASNFTFGLNRSGSARATRISTGLHRLPHPMHKNNTHSLCLIRFHELLPALLPRGTRL